MRSSVVRSWSVIAALMFVPALGCQRPPPKVAWNQGASVASDAFLAAQNAAFADPLEVGQYLGAIDLAVDHPEDPHSAAVVVASVDGLVFWRDDVLGAAYMRAPGHHGMIASRLRNAWERAGASPEKTTPIMRRALALGLRELALFSGEAQGAKLWAERSGFIEGAKVIGPLDTASLGALERPPFVPGLAPFPSTFESAATFSTVATLDIPSRGGVLRVPFGVSGLREYVFDVVNPKSQRLSFSLASSTAATLLAADQTVITRGTSLGSLTPTLFGDAIVSEGVLRVVVRSPSQSGVRVTVLDEAGLPIGTVIPEVGSKPSATVTEARELGFDGLERTDAELSVAAAALLAVGQARRAEHLLEIKFGEKREGREVALHSLFIRAMEGARDMADWKLVERTRASVEEMTRVIPDAHETLERRMELALRRKGGHEGAFEGLAELGVTTPGADLSQLSLERAAVALSLARKVELEDVRDRLIDRLGEILGNAPIVADLELSAAREAGRAWVPIACEGALRRDSTACATAKAEVGDRDGALAEIDRLRELTQAPDGYLSMEFSLREALGDQSGALAVFERALPEERSQMNVVPLVARSMPAERAKQFLLRTLRDSPRRSYFFGIMGLALGTPSLDAERFETEGKALIGRDRKNPAIPGAATAVLKHIEHYGLDPNGLLKVIVYDVRRISGTTDVERSYVEEPSVFGAGGLRVLRRRIHKSDGRVLEGDASQWSSGGDASQLEKGDYLEYYAEGFFESERTGELTFDTPDLLPERASVVDAEVIVRLPDGLPVSLWSHPLMGAPTDETRGGFRFLTYRLKNQPARRAEEGLPYLERGVRLSIGTQTWAKLSHNIGEMVRNLEDDDPFIDRFVEPLRTPGLTPEEQIQKSVELVGKAIRVARPSFTLSDYAGFGEGMSEQPVRAMIEEGTGSRTVVLYRTLVALGLNVDIALAETEPFASDPKVPARPGRFRKPLLVVHGAADTWIDSDGEGPPLPPGFLSPELKGRSAILSDGRIVTLPESKERPINELDLTLELDDRGTARGKAILSLRSDEAQSLAESFNDTVGEQRKNLLRSVVARWIPWASVDDVKLLSNESSWEVIIQADVTIAGFAAIESRDGLTRMLPGMEAGGSSTLVSRYGQNASRDSALTIDTPIQYRIKRSVRLPRGAVIEKLPEAKTLTTRELIAKRDVLIEPGAESVLREVFELNLPTGTIPQESYGDFLKTLALVDAEFQSGLRLRQTK